MSAIVDFFPFWSRDVYPAIKLLELFYDDNDLLGMHRLINMTLMHMVHLYIYIYIY